MADFHRVSRSDSLPPPAPPLPPSRHSSARPGVLQRLVAPLTFGFASKHGASQVHDAGNDGSSGNAIHVRNYV